MSIVGVTGIKIEATPRRVLARSCDGLKDNLISKMTSCFFNDLK